MSVITKEMESKYIELYLQTYSLSEVMRIICNDGISRNKITNILKSVGVYEGLNGPNYLTKKVENQEKLMLERYGVSNISKISSNGWCKTNSIPYIKPRVLDEDYKVYHKKVSTLSKKNIKSMSIPRYCDYTGILFSDEEGPSNPNDHRKRSIDHKVPIIICYLNGISIEDAADKNNLVYVLRYVNSIKGNTLHESFIPIAYKIRKVFINEGFKSN